MTDSHLQLVEPPAYERYTDEQKRECRIEMSTAILTAVDHAWGAYGPTTAFRHLLIELLETARVYELAGATGRPKAKISHGLRWAVLERDAFRCVWCGDWHDLEVDHVIPESYGGPTTLENLQTLCGPCNRRKGASLG